MTHRLRQATFDHLECDCALFQRRGFEPSRSFSRGWRLDLLLWFTTILIFIYVSIYWVLLRGQLTGVAVVLFIVLAIVLFIVLAMVLAIVLAIVIGGGGGGTKVKSAGWR